MNKIKIKELKIMGDNKINPVSPSSKPNTGNNRDNKQDDPQKESFAEILKKEQEKGK